MVAHLSTALLDRADTQKILENKKNNIIAIDRDKDVLTCASNLKKYSNRFKFYNFLN